MKRKNSLLVLIGLIALCGFSFTASASTTTELMNRDGYFTVGQGDVEIDFNLDMDIYRGDLSVLGGIGAGGSFDGDFGNCQNHLDPDITDTVFVDPELPEGTFFYLVTLATATGEMGLEGSTQGQLRVPLTSCP